MSNGMALPPAPGMQRTCIDGETIKGCHLSLSEQDIFLSFGLDDSPYNSKQVQLERLHIKPMSFGYNNKERLCPPRLCLPLFVVLKSLSTLTF